MTEASERVCKDPVMNRLMGHKDIWIFPEGQLKALKRSWTSSNVGHVHFLLCLSVPSVLPLFGFFPSSLPVVCDAKSFSTLGRPFCQLMASFQQKLPNCNVRFVSLFLYS